MSGFPFSEIPALKLLMAGRQAKLSERWTVARCLRRHVESCRVSRADSNIPDLRERMRNDQFLSLTPLRFDGSHRMIFT